MLRLLLVAFLLSIGCATDGVSTWRPSRGTPAAPLAPGAALSGVVAGLYTASSGEGDAVELLELRVLDVGRRPWKEIGPELAAASSRLGVVAHRVCRRRDGLSLVRVERASWMIFHEGALVAYDHGEFEPGCHPGRDMRPASGPDLEVERGLVRYAAQRYPGARPDLEETLESGVVLVEAGRLEDAKRALRDGERAIGALEATEETVFGDEKAALLERIEAARRLRIELLRAIEESAEKRAEAPSAP